MSMDELELRSRLAESAALAGPLGFTAEEVAARGRRIRRRRRSRTGVILGVSVAAVASAIAIPLARGGATQSVISQPARLAPALSYRVTVNGQTRAVGAGAGLPLFTVTPGQKLTMTVKVTVPKPQAMTALWLGITNEVLSTHASMNPLLAARTRMPLRPGAYRFVLHWAVPTGLRPGRSRHLSVAWAWKGKVPGEAASDIADFVVPLPRSARSPAAAARRLRSMTLHSVANCNEAGPASIRAVRTSFGNADAMGWGAAGLAPSDTDPVYVVLMRGDFSLYDGVGPPLCIPHASGHYFWAIVDAATFVTLDASVGDHPPQHQLRNLGRVMNLFTRPGKAAELGRR